MPTCCLARCTWQAVPLPSHQSYPQTSPACLPLLQLRVADVSEKEERRQRPAGLNTVELLKAASSSLGLGPAHAMSIAERLYTQVNIEAAYWSWLPFRDQVSCAGPFRAVPGPGLSAGLPVVPAHRVHGLPTQL
jgi:hypothetical protein